MDEVRGVVGETGAAVRRPVGVPRQHAEERRELRVLLRLHDRTAHLPEDLGRLSGAPVELGRSVGAEEDVERQVVDALVAGDHRGHDLFELVRLHVRLDVPREPGRGGLGTVSAPLRAPRTSVPSRGWRARWRANDRSPASSHPWMRRDGRPGWQGLEPHHPVEPEGVVEVADVDVPRHGRVDELLAQREVSEDWSVAAREPDGTPSTIVGEPALRSSRVQDGVTESDEVLVVEAPRPTPCHRGSGRSSRRGAAGPPRPPRARPA